MTTFRGLTDDRGCALAFHVANVGAPAGHAHRGGGPVTTWRPGAVANEA
jgi:hypothetical protein